MDSSCIGGSISIGSICGGEGQGAININGRISVSGTSGTSGHAGTGIGIRNNRIRSSGIDNASNISDSRGGGRDDEHRRERAGRRGRRV